MVNKIVFNVIHIRVVDVGACGACLSEIEQLNKPYYNIHRLGFFITPTPREADVLLVAGPGRMDSYVNLLQSKGASLIMIAKGNRSQQVTDACKKYGGFYLGSIGGPAALLAEENIKKVECIDFPELGMEAVWKIEVVDFPAFILVDDKGNDFYKQLGC